MALIKTNARSASALDATILTGNLPAINGSALTNLSAGKVLQVVETNYTTYASNSTNSFNTNMNVSITPSATSSKIYVMVSAQLSKGTTATEAVVRIFREVSSSVTATRVMSDLFIWDNGNNNNAVSCVGQWLDSPSTTSAITYQFAWASYDDSNPIYINNYQAGGSHASQITAWEIGA
jgi:hypothetical protein